MICKTKSQSRLEEPILKINQLFHLKQFPNADTITSRNNLSMHYIDIQKIYSDIIFVGTTNLHFTNYFNSIFLKIFNIKQNY